MTRTTNRNQRRNAIAAIMSTVPDGRLRFVSDTHSTVPGRFWIETRYCALREYENGPFMGPFR